jgi:hypothetical protein
MGFEALLEGEGAIGAEEEASKLELYDPALEVRGEVGLLGEIFCSRGFVAKSSDGLEEEDEEDLLPDFLVFSLVGGDMDVCESFGAISVLLDNVGEEEDKKGRIEAEEEAEEEEKEEPNFLRLKMCWLDAGEGGEMERSFKSSFGSESWADGATGADDKKFGEEG